MTSLKQLLLEELQLKGQMTRDDLRNFGRTAKTPRNQHGFDSASVDRDLRHLTNEEQIAPVTRKGYITAYEPFKTQEKPISSHTDSVDDRLRTILKGIKPSWENQPEIKRLEHALKLGDSYKYQKLLIINKYK